MDISARSSQILKLFGPAYLICPTESVPRSVLPVFKSYFAVVDEIRLLRTFIRFLAGLARILQVLYMHSA